MDVFLNLATLGVAGYYFTKSSDVESDSVDNLLQDRQDFVDFYTGVGVKPFSGGRDEYDSVNIFIMNPESVNAMYESENTFVLTGKKASHGDVKLDSLHMPSTTTATRPAQPGGLDTYVVEETNGQKIPSLEKGANTVTFAPRTGDYETVI